MSEWLRGQLGIEDDLNESAPEIKVSHAGSLCARVSFIDFEKRLASRDEEEWELCL